jgi:hypothetical protein
MCDTRPTDVLHGRAICPRCLSATQREHPGVYVLGAFPWDNENYQNGYHCGDPVVTPKWTQPSTPRVGYGGPTKMAAWLPGGAKYTGALHESNGWGASAIGPVRKSTPKESPAPKKTSTTDAAAIASIDQLTARIRDLEALVQRQRETIALQRDTVHSLQHR